MGTNITCRIDELPHSITKLSVCDRINRILQDEGFRTHHFVSLMPVVCQAVDSGYILLSSLPISNYCLVLDAPPASAFIYFIEQFLVKQHVTSGQAFQLIQIASELSISEKGMYRLFHALRWPSGRKGRDWYNIINGASDSVQESVINNRLSVNNAVLLVMAAGKKADILLHTIPDNATHAQVNNIIKMVVEYMRGTKLTMEQVLTAIDWTSRESAIKSVGKLRNPGVTALVDKMEHYIESLHLPGTIRIEYDKKFEKKGHQINLTFTDLKSLTKSVEKLNIRLDEIKENNSATDYFDFETLLTSDVSDGS